MLSLEELQRLTVEYYPLFLALEEHQQLDENQLQIVTQYNYMLQDLVKDLALSNDVNIATASDILMDDLIATYNGYIRGSIISAITEIEHRSMLERVANINSTIANIPDAILSEEEFRLVHDGEFRQQMIIANINDQAPAFIKECQRVASDYFNSIRQQPSGPPKLRA